jgi:hypothetical protein
LPRGRFEIRYAVSQRGGAVGSVVTYVDVPDFAAGEIAISGLLVESRGTATPPRLATTLATSMPANVTAVREFPARGALAFSGVVYADANLPQDGLALEAALLDAAGNVLPEVSKTLQLRARPATADQRQIEVEVPLAGLRPGDYVFKLSARVTAGKKPSVERLVRFSITAN